MMGRYVYVKLVQREKEALLDRFSSEIASPDAAVIGSLLHDPGDRLDVELADGSTITLEVTRVETPAAFGSLRDGDKFRLPGRGETHQVEAAVGPEANAVNLVMSGAIHVPSWALVWAITEEPPA